MESFNAVEMWKSMGWLAKGTAIFMGIMGIWMIAVTIERAIRYIKGSQESFQFVVALRQHLQQGNLDAAIQSARRFTWSPLAKVMEAGLVEYKSGLTAIANKGPRDVFEFVVVDAVNRSLERVKERETTSLRKGLGGLATIASAAPFVGLLGTVVGIINSFKMLSAGGGIDVIGPGIAEALVSTAVGLFVAIPSAMFFNFFTGIVERFTVDINDVSSEFVGYVLKEGRKS